MTLKLNTFEGGTDETVITAGTSGGASGDGFDSVGGSPEWEAGAAYHDTMGMVLPSSSTQRFVYWDFSTNMTFRASCYVRFTSVAPSVVNEFLQFRTAASGQIGGLALNTNGRIVARVTGGSIPASSNISAHAISANNWYRIDVAITVATSTTGRITYGIYNVNSGDTNTPITTVYDSLATLNFGSTAIGRVFFGCIQAQARNGDWQFDTVRAEDGVFSLMGMYVPLVPLTPTFLDNQGVMKMEDGTPPFSIAQTSGATTTAVEIDDGSGSLGYGLWYAQKHVTDTLEYTVTDSAGVPEEYIFSIPPISPANVQRMKPTSDLSGWE